jgi:hypothetical protein
MIHCGQFTRLSSVVAASSPACTEHKIYLLSNNNTSIVSQQMLSHTKYRSLPLTPFRSEQVVIRPMTRTCLTYDHTEATILCCFDNHLNCNFQDYKQIRPFINESRYFKLSQTGWATLPISFPSPVGSVSLSAKVVASGCNRSQSFYTGTTEL